MCWLTIDIGICMTYSYVNCRPAQQTSTTSLKKSPRHIWVWYFISKNQPGLRHSDQFWRSRSQSALHYRVYVASASWYPSWTHNCARLLIVATLLLVATKASVDASKLPKSTRARSHGNNVRDVIIAHVMCGHTNKYMPTDAEKFII